MEYKKYFLPLSLPSKEALLTHYGAPTQALFAPEHRNDVWKSESTQLIVKTEVS